MNENQSKDWSELYQSVLEQVYIPSTSSENLSGETVIVRDMLINLEDVYNKIREKGIKPRIISIFADVVRKTDENSILINKDSALFIVARRIEFNVDSSIILDYREGGIGKLVIYAHEFQSNIKVKGVFPGNKPDILELITPKKKGIVVSSSEGRLLIEDLDKYYEDGFEYGKPLRMNIVSIFQFATILFYSAPDIAQSMLEWISDITTGSKAAVDLNIKSSALLVNLRMSTSPVTFVPYLDKDVYADSFDSFICSASSYETQYQRYSDEKLSFDDRRSAAQNMLDNYKDICKYNKQLILQADSNYRIAQGSEIQASSTLNIQQYKVKQAGISFEYESKKWERDQIIKAVFSMAAALVEFSAAVALMMVGDEAAAAGAAGAVKNGIAAADDAAKVADKVKELSAFAKAMENLSKSMNNLEKLAKFLKTTYETIDKIITAAKKISSADENISVEIPDTDSISTEADWDAFLVDAELFMKPAIDAGIPGALEYKAEIDKLAIYGKAYMATQIAVVKAGQELARLILQREVDQNQEVRLKEYVDKLSGQINKDDEIMQAFFERELNVKCWIFIAVQNYAGAYRYWGLRDSRITLSIVKPVEQLEEDMGIITQEYSEVLESFNPPPQDFRGIVVTIPDTKQGNFHNVVQNLKENRSVAIPISPDAAEFNGLDRVRLTRVRVWLIGVVASKNNPVYIEITTSGIYYDRLREENFEFSSASLRRVFKYNGIVGNESSIIIEGEVEERSKYKYFQPTPFTQWTISVPEAYNQGVDLSTLEAIQIEYAGNVIAH
ncbi:hypothetical protein [Clostridium kluyveri]|uniref:Uncharacterized protein n=2 Tax=Clostridium kluyveri TaxID=1534 RepID=A5N118_CLOK5|nr:hypothetical protein [Clostridium kluyveri]EDK34814.1 Conserved hypothetical protein [Clostridium kluyveri DSM 555]BAH07544.1 hypothetical protein CKR_2493 [Clostridium kluyveri NBRC 12016]